MAARKKYPKEFKLGAVSLVVEQGYTRAQAAQSLDINPNVLGRWITESKQEDGQAFRGNGKPTVIPPIKHGSRGWNFLVK